MRRFLLRFLLVLLVLAAVTTGAGWYLLHDEAFVKSRLKAASLRYAGRELTLQGPVTLDPGRVTTLEAENVHFANPDWAGEPDMVSIGHIRISIDLASLFSDQVSFPALDLQDCRVSLLKRKDGSANWQMGRKKKPSDAPKPPRTQFPVRLDELRADSCEVELTLPKLAVPLDFQVASLSMQHHGDNRWEGSGSGAINDRAFSFEGWMNPFSALFLGGPLSHDIDVDIGGISFQSSGSVQDAKSWTGANVTAEFKGPDIAILLQEFKLPPFSDGAFDFSMKLNTEGAMTQLALDGDLGTVTARASGELDRLVRPSDGNIQVSVDGPNLGALAELFGAKGLVEEPFSHQAKATFRGDAIHIEKGTVSTDQDSLEVNGHFSTADKFAGTDIDVKFHTDEAGRWTTLFGQPRQDLGVLDLDGKLSSDASGLFTVNMQVTQGKTGLSLSGALGYLPRPLAPNLDIRFSSPDASRLAAVAGLAHFPAAPLSVDGRFGIENKELSLGNVRIDLAGDKANIDGTLSLHDRYAGSEATVTVDIRDLNALGELFGRQGLPTQPLQLSGGVKPDDGGLAFQVTDGNLGVVQLELEGRIPDLQKPLVMDGNFDVSLPRLSDVSFLFPNATLPDAPFTATGKVEREGENLRIEQVDINLAGSRAQVDGVIGLRPHYAGSDLKILVEIDNAGQLGRMFGRDDIPEQPVKLDAQVKPDGNGMVFSVSDGNLGDIQLELDGRIADLSKPTALDAHFDVSLPRLSDVSFLFPGREVPAVPFSASGRLVNEQSRTRLDEVRMMVGKVNASIDGAFLPDNAFDLVITAKGSDVSGPAKLFGLDLLPEPFSLSTHLTGNTAEFDLGDLNLSLGQSSATGTLRITRGDVKTISGAIESPFFDISQWMAEKEAEKEEKPKLKRKWVFDDKPVLVVADLPYGFDLDLNVSVLKLENTDLHDVSVGLLMNHSQIELKPFTLKGGRGGEFNGELSLDGHGAIPRFHLSMHGDNMRLGLTAAPGQDPSTFPPIELEVLLNASGHTRREMASSLDGTFRGYYGEGLVAQAGLNLLFSDFLTELFTTLNPFAKTSKYTKLDCAVVAADAVSGKVDVFPIIYNTEQITILSQGVIDLNTEKINLSFNTKPRQGLGISAGVLINPLIKVGGTLAAPAIQLDPAGTVKSTGLAVATAGISLLAKSMSDRFLSSPDPCGDARKEIAKRDASAN